jgi:hypothetical protein
MAIAEEDWLAMEETNEKRMVAPFDLNFVRKHR